ncbi:MAG: hypothetical protein K9N48_00185 [Verrucomicrobia bacterium]|nr:hypothetical protein [Verrucomicrobiota bacterium]
MAFAMKQNTGKIGNMNATTTKPKQIVVFKGNGNEGFGRRIVEWGESIGVTIRIDNEEGQYVVAEVEQVEQLRNAIEGLEAQELQDLYLADFDYGTVWGPAAKREQEAVEHLPRLSATPYEISQALKSS